jgi:molybdopterin converting factor small subunit
MGLAFEMIKIKVEYTAQLRDAAMVAEEHYELSPESCFGQLMVAVGQRHGEPLCSMLMDRKQEMHRWILADRSGKLIRDSQSRLEDGDAIRLMSPISGG